MQIHTLFGLRVEGLGRSGTVAFAESYGSVGPWQQVWAVDVALWELHAGDGKLGEAWAWPTSHLQLLAFSLLLLGTIIYAQVAIF